MATYCVTGGCGFIGSHLVDALIKADHCVIVIDNLSTGKTSNLNPNAKLVEGDIADQSLVAQAMHDVDGCFHLAAIASVQQANQDWLGTHQTNLTGTITVFDCARANSTRGPIPVVYASSAAIYGDYHRQPLTETVNTVPLTAYGADKYACELHGFVAQHVHQVPTVGLRFFNVYGPRQDPNSPYSGVISIFFDHIFKDQGITVYGAGTQSRDFIYVADVIHHLCTSMDKLHDKKLEKASIFNVCTGVDTSINELAEAIFKLCDKPSHIQYEPERRGDIHQSLGNPTLARKHLGIQANIPLVEGLQRLYACSSKRHKTAT